jgi:hypothetical protein
VLPHPESAVCDRSFRTLNGVLRCDVVREGVVRVNATLSQIPTGTARADVEYPLKRWMVRAEPSRL